MDIGTTPPPAGDSFKTFVQSFLTDEVNNAVRDLLPRQFETYEAEGERHLEVEYRLWHRSIDVIGRFFFHLAHGDTDKAQEIADSEQGQHWFRSVRLAFVQAALNKIRGVG